MPCIMLSFYLQDSGSPQVCSASPLANGIVPSQTFAFKAFPGQLTSGSSTGAGDVGTDISLSLTPSGLIDPLFGQQQQQQQQPSVAALVPKTPGGENVKAVCFVKLWLRRLVPHNLIEDGGIWVSKSQ